LSAPFSSVRSRVTFPQLLPSLRRLSPFLFFEKGTRLGVSEHPEDNLNAFRFRLSDADRTDIEAVLERSNGRKMITLIGDCGAEYR
jgi:hypothetical protein